MKIWNLFEFEIFVSYKFQNNITDQTQFYGSKIILRIKPSFTDQK